MKRVIHEVCSRIARKDFVKLLIFHWELKKYRKMRVSIPKIIEKISDNINIFSRKGSTSAWNYCGNIWILFYFLFTSLSWYEYNTRQVLCHSAIFLAFALIFKFHLHFLIFDHIALKSSIKCKLASILEELLNQNSLKLKPLHFVRYCMFGSCCLSGQWWKGLIGAYISSLYRLICFLQLSRSKL